jgi:hypothetical protein
MDYSWSIVVLNFEFLLVLNHDDVIWDCLKREDLGKRSCKYFILKNHRFCFDKLQISFVVLISFFNKTWNFVSIFNNAEKHKLLQ